MPQPKLGGLSAELSRRLPSRRYGFGLGEFGAEPVVRQFVAID